MPASLLPLIEPRGIPVYGEYGYEERERPWSTPTSIPADVRRDAEAHLAALETYLAPPPPDRLGARIATMLAHYWVGAMPGNLQTAVAADWIRNLQDFPEWVIFPACEEWISTQERKPTIAAIAKICRAKVGRELRQRERLRQVVRIGDRGSPPAFQRMPYADN